MREPAAVAQQRDPRGRRVSGEPCRTRTYTAAPKNAQREGGLGKSLDRAILPSLRVSSESGKGGHGEADTTRTLRRATGLLFPAVVEVES
jgi:hypothetical protein